MTASPRQPLMEADGFPLSAGQKALWFMHQAFPDSTMHYITLAVRIQPPLDIAAMHKTLQHLFERHQTLRTVFRLEEDGALRQHVVSGGSVSFEQVDISTWTEERLRQEVMDAYRRPFDLANGAPMRAHLFTDGSSRHVLLVTLHHIAVDGQSMFPLITELQQAYAAITAGNEPTLYPLKNTYREFVEWQSQQLVSDEGKLDLAYFQKEIEGAPQFVDLPTDHPRTNRFGGHGGTLWFEMDGQAMAGMRQLAQAQDVHVFDLLAAAYHVLLYRYSGQNDILVGFLTSGRPQLRFARLMGLFTNPIVLRAVLDPDQPFMEFVRGQHARLVGALEHQNLPYFSLVEHSRIEKLPGYVPLLQNLFNFMKIPRKTPFAELFVPGEHQHERVDFSALSMESFGLEEDGREFDLMLEVCEAPRCWARFKYRADLFDRTTILRIAGHYNKILRGIVDDPNRAISRVPLLSEAERRFLVEDRRPPREAIPNVCVHDLFEAQARRTPDRLAVSCNRQSNTVSLTYAELNRAADSLAGYLQTQGVGPEVLVGVCIERSVDMLIALLAILKAGGAYVPLDPHFPKARLDLILEDCTPLLVLTETHLADLVSGARCIWLDAELAAQEKLSPGRTADASNLAYVLYTSGSTGKPKGVEIPHSAFVNFLISMQKCPGLNGNDTLLAVTTISFDIAGLELMLPLVTGAHLIIATRETAGDGRALATAIEEFGVTVMQATPATWRLMLDAGWAGSSSLKALCGGEALPRELATELLTRTASLWNMYGPTETTIWSAVDRVQSADGPAPLGSPIANTSLYILDRNLEPVPIGVNGELCIGGSGVARGYYQRPELTAARFVPDPFGAPGDRLYKTGDLCRFRPDGSIEFLGRLDDQVKIRGHRIELGDIESALLRRPDVNEAVIVDHEETSGKRLVAYLTAQSGAAHADLAELRADLAKELPDYMIPSAFVYLSALPLTPNGKVDRKSLRALPVEVAVAAGDHESVAPATPTEHAIAKLWSEMLRVANPGIHDSFTQLGGDSLSFALMIVRLSKTLGVELPVRMDEELLTISGLARAADTMAAARNGAVLASADPESHPLRTERNDHWAGRLLKKLSDRLVGMMTRVEVDGLDNIPKHGPLILAVNHISLFDFPIFGAMLGKEMHRLPVDPTFIIAREWRFLADPMAGPLGNTFYIRRGQGDMETLSGALQVLAGGGLIAIMPEGKASRGALRKAKPGVAYLASESGAPVLPVAIYGHDLIKQYWPRLRRVPVHIRVGEPFHVSGGRFQNGADLIMSNIAALMPSEYHGAYSAAAPAKLGVR